MNRNDRPYTFRAHYCDVRGSRFCRIDCPTNSPTRRRDTSKARRAAARRDIRNNNND